MITVKDLKSAIAECEGQRNPNANTCIKLASYYVIKDHLTQDHATQERYADMVSGDSKYSSVSEFGKLIKTKETDSILKKIDELLETLKVFQPDLYKAFMQELAAL